MRCDGKSIAWHVCTILVLIIGLAGVWREHFGLAAVFSITEIIFVALGFAMYSSYTSGVPIVVAVTLLISSLYAVMLYKSGHREMAVPEIC